jgi:riboflavin kinase/FMN adenylyltransferase
MRQEGIEAVIILPFTVELSHLTPEQFISQVLADKLHARAVLVGDNFRFGANHAGDVGTLNALALKYGYNTEIVKAVRRRRHMVSSTAVRGLIQRGDVAMAARLLERPYSVDGDIVSGHGIGSKQTVPTLNLATTAEILPPNGVYITRTYDLDSGRRWNSITNVGTRPTFGGDSLTVETFLLDQLEGATPARIRLEFLRRVRDERRFDSPEALKAQILKDVGRAQAFFRRWARWVHPQPA